MMEVITSRQNSLLTKAVRLQTSKKFRRDQGLFVGDGTKLLEEALKWCPERLEAVILREGVCCPELPDHVRAVQVSQQLMGQISQMEAPEGALFLVKLPREPETVLLPGTLVLDGIQDPGNVGTILRTADALDVPVLLTEGCCDPYNPKTVRATMGAIFRNPPRTITRSLLVERCRAQDIPLLPAALSPEAKDLRQSDLKKAAVVIGSEGKGVSRELLEKSTGQIIIPMHPRCESLNAAVAAAIVLWEMTAL
jgi:TrmH family RNA methyltransferase